MLTTNVSLLIPSRKTYYDYSFRIDEVANEKAIGQWTAIDYTTTTPPRDGYLRFNSFPETKGDAFLDKGAAPGFHLYLFRFGFLKDPVVNLLGRGYARIDMDVKEHIFNPGKESWAEKGELIPSMVEAIAIFWK